MENKHNPPIEELMRQAMAGNRQAYAAVLQKVTHLLRPYLLRRLSNASDIEDLLQEILISIHKARHTYDGNRPLIPWVFAIARFRLNDYLRVHYADKLRFMESLSEAEYIFDMDVTEPAFSFESIKGEIERLPKKQATILELMHQQGYTAREVATQIGMKESAVKVAAYRAYQTLRKKLGDI